MTGNFLFPVLLISASYYVIMLIDKIINQARQQYTGK